MPLIPRHRLRSDNNPCLSPRVPDPGPGAVHFQRFTPQSHAIFVKPSHTALTLVAINTNSDGHVGAAVPAPYSDEQVLIYKGYQSRGRIIVMIMVKSERIQIQKFQAGGDGCRTSASARPPVTGQRHPPGLCVHRCCSSVWPSHPEITLERWCKWWPRREPSLTSTLSDRTRPSIILSSLSQPRQHNNQQLLPKKMAEIRFITPSVMLCPPPPSSSSPRNDMDT